MLCIKGEDVSRMTSKRITVRLVEWTSHHVTELYAPAEHVIDENHSLQEAVRATYSTFPNNCRRVVLERGPVLLWDPYRPWL